MKTCLSKSLVDTLMVANTALKNFLSNASRWFILVALAFALSRTHGTYGIEFFLLVLLGTAYFISLNSGLSTGVHSFDDFLLKGAVTFFLLRLVSHSSLVYSSGRNSDILTYGLIAFATLSFLSFLKAKRTFFLYLSLVALSILLLLVPLLSPSPLVDVFTLSQKAIEHLFSGVNPYTVEYQDKLSEPFGYRPGYSYPPGALLLSAMSQKLTGDPRTVLSLALIGTSFFIAKIAKSLGKTSNTALIFGLLWLAFPVNPLVVEQSWVDPILAFTAATLAYGLQKQNKWWIALSLGIHLSVKQYAPITVGLTLLWLWRTDSLKSATRTALMSSGIFCLITAPFFISAPKAFLQMAYFDVFGQAPRTESFTFFAFLKDTTGISMPDWVTVLVLVSCVLFFSKRWWQSQPKLADWALSLFLTTFLGFLFARRAFCNYFHFSAVFLVMYLLFSFGEKNESNR